MKEQHTAIKNVSELCIYPTYFKGSYIPICTHNAICHMGFYIEVKLLFLLVFFLVIKIVLKTERINKQNKSTQFDDADQYFY